MAKRKQRRRLARAVNPSFDASTYRQRRRNPSDDEEIIRWRFKGLTRKAIGELPGAHEIERIAPGVYEASFAESEDPVFWAGELRLPGIYCDLDREYCHVVYESEDGIMQSAGASEDEIRSIFSNPGVQAAARRLARGEHR
jgi:hypothetical protein